MTSQQFYVQLEDQDLRIAVDRYENDGELTNHGATRSVHAHLDSVIHFENKEEIDKEVHHMKNFRQLLDHQKEKKLISEKASNILETDAEYLLEKWQ